MDCIFVVCNKLTGFNMCQMVRRTQLLQSCIDFTTRCLLASARRKLLGRCSNSWVRTAKNLRHIIMVSRSLCCSSCLLVDIFSLGLCLTGQFMHIYYCGPYKFSKRSCSSNLWWLLQQASYKRITLQMLEQQCCVKAVVAVVVSVHSPCLPAYLYFDCHFPSDC